MVPTKVGTYKAALPLWRAAEGRPPLWVGIFSPNIFPYLGYHPIPLFQAFSNSAPLALPLIIPPQTGTTQTGTSRANRHAWCLFIWCLFASP